MIISVGEVSSPADLKFGFKAKDCKGISDLFTGSKTTIYNKFCNINMCRLGLSYWFYKLPGHLEKESIKQTLKLKRHKTSVPNPVLGDVLHFHRTLKSKSFISLRTHHVEFCIISSI